MTGWVIAAGAVGLLLLLGTGGKKAKSSLPPWPHDIPRTMMISVLQAQKASNHWIAKGQLLGPLLQENDKLDARTLQVLKLWGQQLVTSEHPWPLILRGKIGAAAVEVDARLLDRINTTLR